MMFTIHAQQPIALLLQSARSYHTGESRHQVEEPHSSEKSKAAFNMERVANTQADAARTEYDVIIICYPQQCAVSSGDSPAVLKESKGTYADTQTFNGAAHRHTRQEPSVRGYNKSRSESSQVVGKHEQLNATARCMSTVRLGLATRRCICC